MSQVTEGIKSTGLTYWSDTVSGAENDHISQTLPTGVAQVLNRLDGKPFDDADQRLFEVKINLRTKGYS